MSEHKTAIQATGRRVGSGLQNGAGPNSPAHTLASATPTTAAPAGANSPVDGSLIGRTSIALIAVIGVILICAWLLKRLGLQRERAANRLEIVASRSLGQRERVVIVELEDEWLVLGVTAHNINALHRRPAPSNRRAESNAAPETGARARGRPTFGRALADNVGRLGRRRGR